MTQVKWTEGIQSLLEQCVEYSGMWSVVTFRILGEPLETSNRLNTIIGHFQAVPENLRESIRVTMSSPYVIEGTVLFEEFVSLLKSWLEGEPGQLLGWTVSPPKIGNLDWESKIQSDWLWNPLMKEITRFQGKYLCTRLSGRGNDEIYDVEKEIWASARSLHMQRDEWMRDYIGANVSPVTNSYLYVVLPITVAVDCHYIEEDNQCQATVTYRNPYTIEDFWIRLGTGRWENSLPVYRLHEEVALSDGWKQAHFIYDLSSSIDQGDTLNVWVGEGDSEATFLWSTRVELKSSNTPEDIRRRFLSTWYEFGSQSIAQHVQKQGVGSKASSGRVQDNFEVLLSNVCGSLGYSVLFGGRALSTGGIDFIAFDSQTKQVYLFSVTVSNDVREKVRTLVLALEDIRPDLNGWSLCPLIVCRVTTNCFLPEDLRNAQELGIPILGEEDLESLKTDPPDLERFEELLRGLF